jgi:predicted  nucleic acid-binding Zn-ribbon protein
LNQDIQQLLELQTIDLKILQLQRELEHIPQRETEIHMEMQKVQALVAGEDARVKDLEKQCRSLEGEVELLKAKKVKLRQQQMEVKTNEQYQAILAEIDYLEKQIYGNEDSILEMMETVESTRRQVETNKKRIKEDSERFRVELERLKDSTTFLQDELAELRRRREESSRNLPSRLMALYNKLSGGLGGIALAEAKDEICQVCHVHIRPQMYQEIRVSDQLFQCEACSRILYYSGDL